jgi:hypothetical protein
MEIALLLTLILVLTWAEAHVHEVAAVVEVLVLFVVNYVIARVVHAEVIPGHNQFWLTRPYRWSGLLAAKILFIAVFVNLPIFAAQCYMIVSEGFSFSGSFAGLAWSQVLLVICILLPAMCLASLTAGLMPFLFSEFILVGGIVIVEALHARPQLSGVLPASHPGLEPIDWVRDVVVQLIMTGVAVLVLGLQYKTRQTQISARYAIAGAVISLLIFLFLPWGIPLGVQSLLSSEPGNTSQLHVRLDSVVRSVFPPPNRGRSADTPSDVSLPIVIEGIGESKDLQVDTFSLSLIGADGRTWSANFIEPIEIASEAKAAAGKTMSDAILHIDPAFFAAEQARPVTVHAIFYLTAFGDPHGVTIPVSPQPVHAIDGLECFAGRFNQLSCVSIFRWPRRRVFAKADKDGLDTFIRSISYSPFPATFGIDPIELHSFSGSLFTAQAIVTTKAPISHFKMEAEMPGVMLADYTVEAKRRAMIAPAPRMSFHPKP